jgi:hypothetical protein
MIKNFFKLLVLLITLFLILIVFFKPEYVKYALSNNLSFETKAKIKTFLFGEDFMKDVVNLKYYQSLNYNTELLPNTQFTKLNVKTISLQDLELSDQGQHYGKFGPKGNKKFFLEEFKGKIYIVDVGGKIFSKKISDIKNNEIKWKKVSSNLRSIEIYDLLDIKVINENLYVSYATILKSQKNKTVNGQCKNYSIFKAKLNKDDLNFEKVFISNECVISPAGGRIQALKFKNVEGFLFTVGAVSEEAEFAQDDSTIIGKILFFDLSNNTFQLFSKGHRNQQGLYVDENVIISTEHGPRGGDEINKIEFNQNFGWPIASYGEKYSSKENLKNYEYKKKHNAFNFVEPIISFVPSIGISEIIKLDQGFTNLWQDNYIVASLGAKAIYRILFDENFTKVLFSERIFIGDRIRDMKFIKKDNSILLALENKYGALMILKGKNG